MSVRQAPAFFMKEKGKQMKKGEILEGVVNGIATAFGFLVSIVLMAGIREKIEYNDIPEAFKGTPIVLVTAGLMAIAFFGFSGLI